MVSIPRSLPLAINAGGTPDEYASNAWAMNRIDGNPSQIMVSISDLPTTHGPLPVFNQFRFRRKGTVQWTGIVNLPFAIGDYPVTVGENIEAEGDLRARNRRTKPNQGWTDTPKSAAVDSLRPENTRLHVATYDEATGIFTIVPGEWAGEADLAVFQTYQKYRNGQPVGEVVTGDRAELADNGASITFEETAIDTNGVSTALSVPILVSIPDATITSATIVGTRKVFQKLRGVIEGVGSPGFGWKVNGVLVENEADEEIEILPEIMAGAPSIQLRLVATKSVWAETETLETADIGIDWPTPSVSSASTTINATQGQSAISITLRSIFSAGQDANDQRDFLTYSIQSGSLPAGGNLAAGELLLTFPTAGSFDLVIRGTSPSGSHVDHTFTRVVAASDVIPPALIAFTNTLDVDGKLSDLKWETDDPTGTFFALLSVEATRTGAQIAAGGGLWSDDVPAQVGDAVMTIPDTSVLTYAAAAYFHVVQRDPAGNYSNILTYGPVVVGTPPVVDTEIYNEDFQTAPWQSQINGSDLFLTAAGLTISQDIDEVALLGSGTPGRIRISATDNTEVKARIPVSDLGVAYDFRIRGVWDNIANGSIATGCFKARWVNASGTPLSGGGAVRIPASGSFSTIDRLLDTDVLGVTPPATAAFFEFGFFDSSTGLDGSQKPRWARGRANLHDIFFDRSA